MMTNWKITPPTARAAANVITRIRNRSGGTEWGSAGVEDALLKNADMADEPDLIIAMIEAARRPENRTPAIIAHPGPHWKQAESPVTYPKPTSDQRCAECQAPDGPTHPTDHAWVKPTTRQPTNAERRRELVEEVKAARAAGRAQLCRHGGRVCALCDAGRDDPAPMPPLEPIDQPGEVPVAP